MSEKPERMKCYFDKKKNCVLHTVTPHAYSADHGKCTNCLIHQILKKLK